MASPPQTRIRLPDLGWRGRWRAPRRRWLEVPGHVLRQGRVLLPARRVPLGEVASLRFVPGSQTLSLAVDAGRGEVVVELLRLTQFRELTRTPTELEALADGLAPAPVADGEVAVAALRAQARHLATEHSGGPMVSPMAPYVGQERASWMELGNLLP
ncbi:MAG TPA: hypothetical protein VFD41_09740 [Actinomycetales bacterium]|nr:hypothetical protein [Actinomycetales bacterium]